MEHFELPPPGLSPRERLRRRLSHRNERRLYRRNCSHSGSPMISIYSPDKPFSVYKADVWWSDAWDATSYGRDFNFSRPFFDQFFELKCAVPRLGLMNVRAENSDYCNITNSNRDCYLVFGGDYNESCFYSVFPVYCRSCLDVYALYQSELCFECVDCSNCYNLRYSQDCELCRDSAFMFDCRNCADCFGCVGLRNASNCFFNEQLTAPEYGAKLAAINFGSRQEMSKYSKSFSEFRRRLPHRAVYITNSENCSGNRILGAKNCLDCFDIQGPAEDFKDVFLGGYDARDIFSSDHVGFKSELFYEVMSGIEGYSCALSCFAWSSQEVMYSDFVVSSKNLFGCAGMKRAENCIFNKPYSQHEYDVRRKRIISHMKETGEWGEFFPTAHSFFGYNETVAQDIFPLTKEQAFSHSYNWTEEEIYSGEPNTPPDNINRAGDEILAKQYNCAESGKAYRIIKEELKFYRNSNLPLPALAPEARNKIRIDSRGGCRLYPDECSACKKSIQSRFSKAEGLKLLCDDCYVAYIEKR